jgi:hypothetical protein
MPVLSGGIQVIDQHAYPHPAVRSLSHVVQQQP